MGSAYKPQVFISSSINGSEDLRSSLIKFLKNEKHYTPVYFGDKFSSNLTGKPGIVEQCLNGVRSSDAFFLIIDRRYGFPDQKDEDGNLISITEKEFLEARKHKNIHIYVFCRNEVWIAHKIWETNPNMNFDFNELYFNQRYDNSKLLMMFLTRIIEKDYDVNRFDDVEEFKRRLSENKLSIDSLITQPIQLDENDNLEVNS